MSTTDKKPRCSGRRMSFEEKCASRDKAVDAIRKLLAQGSMSTSDVAEKIGLHRSTVHAHLVYMEAELREVYRGDPGVHGLRLWYLGRGEEQASGELRVKRPVEPAQQIGMWRDGLVAALFGPAGLGAAA